MLPPWNRIHLLAVPELFQHRKLIERQNISRWHAPRFWPPDFRLHVAYMRDLVLCTSHAIFVVTSRQQILHHRNARNWLMSNVLAHCCQCGRLCWRGGPASLGYDGTEFQSYRNGVSLLAFISWALESNQITGWCWPKHPAYCVFINAEEIFRQKIDSQS